MFTYRWLEPKEWNYIWQKETRMFYLALWFFVIRIDFGKGWRIKELQKLLKKYEKNCLVCKKPLNVKSADQVIKYHNKCRKLRKNHV